MRRCNCDDRDIMDTLCENEGKLCSIYTERGGIPFTGVVSYVDNEVCRLIAMDDDHGCCFGRRGRYGIHGLGTVLTIPLDKITCVSTLQF